MTMILALEHFPEAFRTIYNVGVLVDQMYCFFLKRKLQCTVHKILQVCSSSNLPCDDLMKHLLSLETCCPEDIKLVLMDSSCLDSSSSSSSHSSSHDVEVLFLRTAGGSPSQSTKRLKALHQGICDVLKAGFLQHHGIQSKDKTVKAKWSAVVKDGWPADVVVQVPPLSASGLENLAKFHRALTRSAGTSPSSVYTAAASVPAAAVGVAVAAAAASESSSGDDNPSSTDVGTDKSTAPVSLVDLGGPLVVLEKIKELLHYKDQVCHAELIPGRPARMAALRPTSFRLLSPALHNRLGVDLSAEGLYQHQAEAIDGILEGKHAVISTSTASGKSLCYNLPVVNAVLTDPQATALYLFPTKALAQDQLRVLLSIVQGPQGPLPVQVCTLDGDTPHDDRKHYRDHANVFLSNPDLLHHTLLPGHAEWKRLLSQLKFVVIDEAHMYHGVFGSHVRLFTSVHTLSPPSFPSSTPSFPSSSPSFPFFPLNSPSPLLLLPSPSTSPLPYTPTHTPTPTPSHTPSHTPTSRIARSKLPRVCPTGVCAPAI